jgi:hypothetical protein
MLILRDAFLGMTRFDQFRERLGIPRNILDQRLNRLVDGRRPDLLFCGEPMGPRDVRAAPGRGPSSR